MMGQSGAADTVHLVERLEVRARAHPRQGLQSLWAGHRLGGLLQARVTGAGDHHDAVAARPAEGADIAKVAARAIALAGAAFLVIPAGAGAARPGRPERQSAEASRTDAAVERQPADLPALLAAAVGRPPVHSTRHAAAVERQPAGPALRAATGGALAGGAAGQLWVPCVGRALGQVLNQLPARPVVGGLELAVYVAGILAPLAALAALLHLAPDRLPPRGRAGLALLSGSVLVVLALLVATGRHDEVTSRLVQWSLT